MARIPPIVLRRYLSGGHLPTKGCLRMRGTPLSARPLCVPRCHTAASVRAVHTAVDPLEADVAISFRKQLKEEAKRRKAEGGLKKANIDNQVLEEWELTVGIEIHAQLNTARKLFSSAASTINDEPNTHVALFDVAMPGSQPHFQKETIIPAIRAAMALNCNFNLESRFDRKHYFHWDQPSGYQITQYYQPFATDGYITLYAHDGIAKEDGESVRIGIKQVQMEQDTAKTISQPGDIHLLDFNRVGLPLIEIITLPQIHYPSTAAALVRKIQIMLNAVDACVLGMESGGLRADVNVSVRKRDTDHEAQIHEYAGVRGLGQRTEIKNLSSFKAVEDAIIAERDRQIKVLEDGGKIEGETRGWSIGSSETRRLRGKEGEVDYRYMPDPDLPPLLIGSDLIDHLSQNLGVLPDEELNILTDDYGLTVKDAMTLVSLDDGGRVEYFRNVVDELLRFDKPHGTPHETANLAHADSVSQSPEIKKAGRVVANWVLHEMGGLVLDSGEDASHLGFTSDGDCLVSAQKLATLIYFLEKKSITGKTAKKLLVSLFENALEGTSKEVEDMIEEGGLWFRPMTEEEYVELARSVLDARVVEQILKGQKGKIMYLVGQMMRNGEDGRVDPQEAKRVIERVVEEYRS